MSHWVALGRASGQNCVRAPEKSNYARAHVRTVVHDVSK